MDKKKNKTFSQKIRSPKSISFTLWLIFFILAAVIVTVCEFSQLTIVRQIQRTEAINTVKAASKEIVSYLNRTPIEETSNINNYIIYLSDRYGVTIKLIDENGMVTAPRFDDHSGSNQTNNDNDYDYTKLLPQLREYAAGAIFYAKANTYAYTMQLQFGETSLYLYVGDTISISDSGFFTMGVQTLYVYVIVLIIVTILTGLVSSYVTQPITELTEKAKKMSGGNLNIDFSTTEKSTYREVETLSKTLNYAEGELSKADQMQKELIANVSHDFKTPLTMIKAYASMIQEISGDIPEKRNKHAQVIIDESDRLASLVNDMLDLSKLRAGINSPKTDLFNLSDCLRIVVSRFDFLRETSGYKFVTDITDGLFVEADKNKISQVLYNLIGNAVNYTGENKTIYIRLYNENSSQHFSVTDTGKGIPPEEMSTIWDRYYRSAETHKRPVKGTGLGLSIVKTILDLHGYNFGVHSEIGKGSTFYVDFPAANATELPE